MVCVLCFIFGAVVTDSISRLRAHVEFELWSYDTFCDESLQCTWNAFMRSIVTLVDTGATFGSTKEQNLNSSLLLFVESDGFILCLWFKPFGSGSRSIFSSDNKGSSRFDFDFLSKNAFELKYLLVMLDTVMFIYLEIDNNDDILSIKMIGWKRYHDICLKHINTSMKDHQLKWISFSRIRICMVNVNSYPVKINRSKFYLNKR